MQALELGRMSLAKGEFDQALASCQEARGLFHERGDRMGEATSLHGSGAAYLKLNRPSDALDCLLGALDMHRELNTIQFEAPVAADVGAVYKEMRRFDEAQRHYEDALRIYKLLGDEAEVRRAKAKIAEIAALRGSR